MQQDQLPLSVPEVIEFDHQEAHQIQLFLFGENILMLPHELADHGLGEVKAAQVQQAVQGGRQGEQVLPSFVVFGRLHDRSDPPAQGFVQGDHERALVDLTDRAPQPPHQGKGGGGFVRVDHGKGPAEDDEPLQQHLFPNGDQGKLLAQAVFDRPAQGLGPGPFGTLVFQGQVGALVGLLPGAGGAPAEDAAPIAGLGQLADAAFVPLGVQDAQGPFAPGDGLSCHQSFQGFTDSSL